MNPKLIIIYALQPAVAAITRIVQKAKSDFNTYKRDVGACENNYNGSKRQRK